MTPIRRLALLPLLAAALHAADAVRSIPPEAAELLHAVAELEPADALQRFAAYKGPDHAMITLVRGQVRMRLAQEAQPDARQAAFSDAEADFSTALKLDASLRQAHLGLAQCAAARDDWATASRCAAAACEPGRSDRGLIIFLAQAAQRAGDWRLATLAAQEGVLRFPDDDILRRVELSVLANAGRGEDARQAVLALLARHPDDVELWNHLAWAAQATGREDESLAAREAALALRPDDRILRRRLAEAQLGRGMPQAALTTITPLLGDQPDATALADSGLMLLACRAASDAGESARARAWLAAIPEPIRDRSLRILDARLALQANDQAGARAALTALIELGESDPGVLTWAAALAEQGGDAAQAEALLLKAMSSEQGSAAATLRLTALYIRQDRREEASGILATHLAKHPEDAQARALQARLAPATVKPRR